MDETDGGSGTPGAVPDEPAPQRSRRWFVAGGLALVAGAGGGVAVGFAHDSSHPGAHQAVPAALWAALIDERELVRAAELAQSDSTIDATVTAAVLRDHRSHLAALEAAVREFWSTPTRTPPSGTGSAVHQRHGRAALRTLEQRASQRAASRAAQLSGPSAALLASVAACEATHAELLR